MSGKFGKLHELSGKPCHYCGGDATTADHVVPRALGGTDGQHNLVPCCRPCNQAKGDQLPTCRCEFCGTALKLWRYRPKQHGGHPLPLGEVDKLQQWLDRHLPGQTV